MMTKKTFFLGMLEVALAFGLLAGCTDLVSSDDTPQKTASEEVDFTSHNSGYSILVENGSSEKLVAFKGALSAETLIGGIPARASSHGLPKDPALFNKSEDFPLILLTEEQYKKNKDDLKALEQNPFTRIYAFYNATGTNENVYQISGKLGGDNILRINNLVEVNVELRLNGIHGEIIGYAAKTMHNTKLYLTHGDYILVPLFKTYNAVRDEIISTYPQRANGDPMYIQFELGEDTHEIVVNMNDFRNSLNYSTGFAWLTIDNQSDMGIQFHKGGVPQTTSTGIATLNSAFSRQFPVAMAQISTNPIKYASTANIGAYKVGPSSDLIPIGDYELSVDKKYKITVTGSANYNTLEVTAPVEIGDIREDL